jgi:hypothetical protein
MECQKELISLIDTLGVVDRFVCAIRRCRMGKIILLPPQSARPVYLGLCVDPGGAGVLTAARSDRKIWAAIGTSPASAQGRDRLVRQHHVQAQPSKLNHPSYRCMQDQF